MAYEDIDPSLEENIRGDFSSVKGIINVVRNNLTNNLQISAEETPFENTNKPDINDIIHSTSNIRNIMLKDAIEYSLIRDDRVKTIKSIDVIDENDSYLVVSVKVQLIDKKDLVSFNVKITRT